MVNQTEQWGPGPEAGNEHLERAKRIPEGSGEQVVVDERGVRFQKPIKHTYIPDHGEDKAPKPLNVSK